MYRKLVSNEIMTEQEQRLIEGIDRATQIKIVKLYADLRINIAGFFGCFIGAIASIAIAFQIWITEPWWATTQGWVVFVLVILSLLGGYVACIFIDRLKAVHKKINELT